MRNTFPILTLLAATVFAPSALGDPAGSALSVGYTLAFWAIPFGHTDYDSTLGVNGYNAKAHFETGGVVGVFWKSVIDATANGAIAAHTITPVLYDSYAQDRNKPKERVKVSYENNIPATFADPPYDTTKYPVSEDQRKDSVDPMSAVTAILTGVKADAKNPCGTGVRVFDGRRRYDVSFTYLKEEGVKLSNGLFSGTAHLCEIHYNQVAGYKARVGVSTTPPMFGDFIDVPAPNAPAGHYVVAVKLWAPLSLGTVTVTLNHIKVDGAAPPGMATKG